MALASSTSCDRTCREASERAATRTGTAMSHLYRVLFDSDLFVLAFAVVYIGAVLVGCVWAIRTASRQ